MDPALDGQNLPSPAAAREQRAPERLVFHWMAPRVEVQRALLEGWDELRCRALHRAIRREKLEAMPPEERPTSDDEDDDAAEDKGEGGAISSGAQAASKGKGKGKSADAAPISRSSKGKGKGNGKSPDRAQSEAIERRGRGRRAARKVVVSMTDNTSSDDEDGGSGSDSRGSVQSKIAGDSRDSADSSDDDGSGSDSMGAAAASGGWKGPSSSSVRALLALGEVGEPDVQQGKQAGKGSGVSTGGTIAAQDRIGSNGGTADASNGSTRDAHPLAGGPISGQEAFPWLSRLLADPYCWSSRTQVVAGMECPVCD